jgi:hypothetical protein
MVCAGGFARARRAPLARGQPVLPRPAGCRADRRTRRQRPSTNVIANRRICAGLLLEGAAFSRWSPTIGPRPRATGLRIWGWQSGPCGQDASQHWNAVIAIAIPEGAACHSGDLRASSVGRPRAAHPAPQARRCLPATAVDRLARARSKSSSAPTTNMERPPCATKGARRGAKSRGDGRRGPASRRPRRIAAMSRRRAADPDPAERRIA